MSSPQQQDVSLPESVEQSIKRICVDRNQPPLGICARNMLAAIGEQASVEILNTVLYSNGAINSFDRFVCSLVSKNYPAQSAAVLSVFNSPNCSPSSASPHIPNVQSLQSPLSSFPVNSSSSLPRRDFQNINCQLSFEDETSERRNPRIRDRPSDAGRLGETSNPPTVSPQMLVLSELEFRKFFLVLSYIGRKKFEAVVSPDDANQVYRMKDLPMKDFESEIWNKYGCKFCESDRDRIQGPYLNSATTHLQRSLYDENILIVKFEGGAYDPRKFVEEGIFIGLRRYQFFGDYCWEIISEVLIMLKYEK